MFVFLASVCERLSRKQELIYLDLGIGIEAADSSQRRRPAVEHAQQLPVPGHYTGAGPTHGLLGEPLRPMLPKMRRSSCEQFMQAFHRQSRIPPSPAAEIPSRLHLNLVAGFNPCIRQGNQRWCNCLQPGPNNQVARAVVQNMMAAAGRSSRGMRPGRR